MPRNGSGVYSLPAGTLATTHTTISPTAFNAWANDVATELTNSMAVSGVSPLTGPLNMTNNPINNVSDPSNLQDAATKNYVDGTSAMEVSLSATASVTLTEPQAAARLLILTGTLTANVTITFPAAPINQTWIDNQCTMGAYTITIASIGAGTSVVLSNAGITPVFHDATNIISLINPAPLQGKNRIINGAMDTDQRNSGASGTANNVYTVDRWGYAGTQASKGTWGQNLNSATSAVGFPHYLGFQSSSTYSVASSDFFGFYQYIEAANVEDLAWGTANAQAVTFSFRVYSSLTGTFGGSLCNYAQTRSYPFSYTISAANTWTTISVTIPGDTAGTWVMSGSGGSLAVRFGLGSGSTYSGTAGAWASGNFIQPTGMVSVVGTSGATFYVTGVQLEVGSVATPFERRLIGIELALCQRYFWAVGVNQLNFVFPAFAASAEMTFPILFPVPMRTTPSYTAPTWYLNTVSTPSINIGPGGCVFVVTSVGSGNVVQANNSSLVLFSAEL